MKRKELRLLIKYSQFNMIISFNGKIITIHSIMGSKFNTTHIINTICNNMDMDIKIIILKNSHTLEAVSTISLDMGMDIIMGADLEIINFLIKEINAEVEVEEEEIEEDDIQTNTT